MDYLLKLQNPNLSNQPFQERNPSTSRVRITFSAVWIASWWFNRVVFLGFCLLVLEAEIWWIGPTHILRLVSPPIFTSNFSRIYCLLCFHLGVDTWIEITSLWVQIRDRLWFYLGSRPYYQWISLPIRVGEGLHRFSVSTFGGMQCTVVLLPESIVFFLYECISNTRKSVSVFAKLFLIL